MFTIIESFKKILIYNMLVYGLITKTISHSLKPIISSKLIITDFLPSVHKFKELENYCLKFLFFFFLFILHLIYSKKENSHLKSLIFSNMVFKYS